MPKPVPLTDELADYVDARRHDAGDPLLDELRGRTVAAFGEASRMQVAGDQGAFLTILVAAIGARRCVEVGTFTGHSAICIARGLAPRTAPTAGPAGGGRLTCFDASREYTDLAREYWAKAGVDDRIDLRLGDAKAMLDTLPDFSEEASPGVDFAFIDADKTGYAAYYEKLLPKLRPGGLIAFDNMLWDGKVVDAADSSEDTQAIRDLNDRLTADDRVDNALLTVGDGIHLCRKR